MTIVGEAVLDADGVLHGWCWDAQRPQERLLLDVSINNKVVTSVIASRFREDVRDRKLGDGYHGFHVILTKLLELSLGCTQISLHERRSGYSFWHKTLGEFLLPEGLESRISACKAELGRLAWSPPLVASRVGGKIGIIRATISELTLERHKRMTFPWCKPSKITVVR